MERIQPFGFLIAAYANGVIARASENLVIFLDIPGEKAIGRRLDELIEANVLLRISRRLETLSEVSPTSRLYGVILRHDRKPIDLSVHRSGAMMIIEGEWSGLEKCLDAAERFRDSLWHLIQATTLEQFHRDAAKYVRKLTGFERVLIYQFEHSGIGHVIAEDVIDGVDSFLDLRYPASDVPSQARALYLRNPFRVISNVSAPSVRILPLDADDAERLDLTLSTTREVSPIHLEYLRNMRVGASLSISIIVNGRLWGLIVCHHHQAKRPAFSTRTAIELFGQMYAMALAPRLLSRQDDEDREVRLGALRVVDELTRESTLVRDLTWLAHVIEPFIRFDGIALMVDGKLSSRGITPDLLVMRKIIRWLSSALIVKPFATDNFEWQRIAKTSIGCRGLFAIPLSNTSRDIILLFRGEHVSHIVWGGDPNKASWGEEGQPYLSPRKSFAPFTEEVADQAKPHTPRELRAAEILMDALSIAGNGPRAIERRLSHRLPAQGGDELVADLLRRVPAVFLLISELVDGQASDRRDVTPYCEALGERIAALAVAYDRQSNSEHNVVSLQSLFRNQFGVQAHLIGNRVAMAGKEQDLQPEAVLPIALIVYELISAALTTGALASNGRVNVNVARTVDGLILTWREMGMPESRSEPSALRATRLNLVRRVVTDSLHGSTDIEFFPDEVEVRLFVPEKCLAA